MGANPLLDIPGIHIAQAVIPAHAAADVTQDHPIFRAEGNCEIISVDVIPDAAITGANTNSANLNLKSWTDAASPVATERANRDYVSGTDEVAMKARRLYAPATALALTAGQYLSIEREKVGTGLALPTFLAVVRFRAN